MARRYALSEEAARRVIAATRAYERGNRDMPPIKFRTANDDGIEDDCVGDGSGSGCCQTIGGRDISAIEGYDPEAIQILGHEYGCLVWISTTDCGS